MEIDGWLRGMGLAQYAEMFRANDIDIELLGKLTNDDLKDIGVPSFGHRKMLLQAIAELGSAPPAAPAPPPAAQLSLRNQCSMSAPVNQFRRRAHGSMIRVRFKRPHQAYATEIADF